MPKTQFDITLYVSQPFYRICQAAYCSGHPFPAKKNGAMKSTRSLMGEQMNEFDFLMVETGAALRKYQHLGQYYRSLIKHEILNLLLPQYTVLFEKFIGSSIKTLSELSLISDERMDSAVEALRLVRRKLPGHTNKDLVLPACVQCQLQPSVVRHKLCGRCKALRYCSKVHCDCLIGIT